MKKVHAILCTALIAIGFVLISSSPSYAHYYPGRVTGTGVAVGTAAEQQGDDARSGERFQMLATSRAEKPRRARPHRPHGGSYRALCPRHGP